MKEEILQKQGESGIVCPVCKKTLKDGEFKSFQRKWYDSLTVSQGVSRYNPNADGKLGFSQLRNFVDVLDKEIFDSLGFHENSKILDVGCNFGRRLNQLSASYNVKGTGIDISFEAIKLAEKIRFLYNRYYVCDAESLPFPQGYFDYVVSFGLLEHLPKPQECLKEIARVSKKNAKILIATVNKKDKYTFHWLLNKISFGKLSRESKRCGAHRQEYFLDKDELKKMLKENSFKLEKIIYSHSFFLLIYDECIYAFLLNLYKLFYDLINFNRKRAFVDYPGVNRRSTPCIFKVYARIVVYLYRIAKLMDTPWLKRGFSYYLYIIAEKE